MKREKKPLIARSALANIGLMLCFTVMFNATPLSAQWHYMGMKDRMVYRLKIEGDTLYAATSEGIFKKHYHTPDTIWIPAGLQGLDVVDLALACSERIFAYTYDKTSAEFHLYFSQNGGHSYNLFHPDPGTTNFFYCNTSRYVDIAPGQTDTVYLLPHWQYTHNGGATWHNIPFDPTTVGNMVRFVKVNPENPSEVWIGGENMIFSPILLHSVNSGVSFTQLPTNGFFNGDNCLHDIIADGEDWFIAGEGIVSRTYNLGVTWDEKLNLWSSQYDLYLNAIAFGPANRNTIYTTGGGFNTFNQIVLMASHNRGLTWDTLTWTPPHGAGLHFTATMAVGRVTNDKVFLGGTTGVYLYDALSTNIPVRKEQQVWVYPNPASDWINIRFPNDIEYDRVSVSLFDITGKEVAKYNNPAANGHTISLPLNKPSGIYILAVYSNKGIIARERIIVR